MVTKLELKENMYVRYKYCGVEKINKIDFIKRDELFVKQDELFVKDFIYLFNDDRVLKNSILKASFNLIDLIKKGDYVNSLRVCNVSMDEEGNVIDIGYCEETEMQVYSIDEIKDIVTKEQFDACKYVVERDK